MQKGLAEIDGMPDKVLRGFSRRRAEIEEAMARHGASGFEAAQIAALSTRRQKDRSVRPEQLVSEWRERAIGHGLHHWRIQRIRRPARVPEPPRWEELFAHMAGPDGLTRDRSSFGRRDVIQALSSAASEGATVESIRSAADAFLSREHDAGVVDEDVGAATRPVF